MDIKKPYVDYEVKEVNLTNLDSTTKDSPLFNNPIQQRWDIIGKIGSGGFGIIYKAYDLLMKDMVAIKVEKRSEKSGLLKEVSYYKYIERHSQYSGLPQVIPKCRWQGKEEQTHIAVFDLLGLSLSDLFQKCDKKFSLKTVLMLADQLVDRLSLIHQCGVIHGDVKPGNFVVGSVGNEKNIYVIDFGLSNFWRDKYGKHIPFHTDCAFRGTYRYASINSHFKMEQSRRDDLESLGYVLIYFLKGKLPWQNLKISKNDRRKVIGKIKSNINIDQITEDIPMEFSIYMNYVRKLRFSDEPDYIWIKSLFKECMRRHYIQYDYKFDWNESEDTLDSTTKLESYLPNNFKSLLKTDHLDHLSQYQYRQFSHERLPWIWSNTMTLVSPYSFSFALIEGNDNSKYFDNLNLLHQNSPILISPAPSFNNYYQHFTQPSQLNDVVNPINIPKKRKRCQHCKNCVDISSASKRIPTAMNEQ